MERLQIKSLMCILFLVYISIMYGNDIKQYEIGQYFEESSCQDNPTQVCKSIEDLLNSLRTLDKIQKYNFFLTQYADSTHESNDSKPSKNYQKNTANTSNSNRSEKVYKDISESATNEKQDSKVIHSHNDLQSENIIIVELEEYLALKESLLRFCKNFKRLKDTDKQLLFRLNWNKNPLFENENDIKKFCKQKKSWY